MFAEGCMEATRIASAMSCASMTKKLPICSFVSANGPSVTTTFPLEDRRVVTSHEIASWMVTIQLLWRVGGSSGRPSKTLLRASITEMPCFLTVEM